jgi:RNA polymerase sigma factor (sigma-70 family)
MKEMVVRPSDLPPEVVDILRARAPDELDDAWAAFVQVHSKLIFHVAHAFGGSHDRTMDAYAFILERLRSDDCRRLRGFAADGRSRFSTWLVVVCRRLCLDLHRQTYGRAGRAQNENDASEKRGARKRLADLVSDRAGIEQIEDSSGVDPERRLRQADLSAALRDAIHRLEPDEQLLLRLRFDDDLTAKEIARLIQMPSPFHVYRRLQRLLTDLRRNLYERGVEEAAP